MSEQAKMDSPHPRLTPRPLTEGEVDNPLAALSDHLSLALCLAMGIQERSPTGMIIVDFLLIIDTCICNRYARR